MDSENIQKAATATIDVLSIFPQTVRSVLDSSILRRAQAAGLVDLESTDLRAFTEDKHRSVDDTPFGGNQGMLFTAPVIERAMQDQLAKVGGNRDKLKILYPSPRGIKVEQGLFWALAEWLHREPGGRVCVLAGRYEGIDERAVNRWVDLEVSVGDFILTGGELPALMIVDGVVRLLPGVLGDERSHIEESFHSGLLEFPQFTKPADFLGQKVPDELRSGHHAKITEWKLRQSLLYTYAFRPDLIRVHQGADLPDWARSLLDQLKNRLELRP